MSEPKGNPEGQSMRRAQHRESVVTCGRRIRQFVQREPRERLTALLHHVTVDALRWAFFELKKNAAACADGMTWGMYAEGLKADWPTFTTACTGSVPGDAITRGCTSRSRMAAHDRSASDRGQDSGQWIILTPNYEAESGFSYGFRPGRGAHNALDALAVGIDRRRSVGWWIVTSARSSTHLKELVSGVPGAIGDKRDQARHQVVERWRHGSWRVARGTPQGSVISPIEHLPALRP